MTDIFTYYDLSIVRSFVNQMTRDQREELATLPMGASYRGMLHYSDLLELARTFVDGQSVVDAGTLLVDGCTLLNSEEEDEC